MKLKSLTNLCRHTLIEKTKIKSISNIINFTKILLITLILRSRILKLELTDGKRTVSAIEYRHIPCLTTKLVPGSKLLLTGPIRCVNKVLFLESKHIHILGGEVDTILISNAYENILLKALNKPINEHPKVDYAGKYSLLFINIFYIHLI